MEQTTRLNEIAFVVPSAAAF